MIQLHGFTLKLKEKSNLLVIVYAKKNKLWFTINGKIASEVIDNEKAKRLDKGFIGFQLHSGDKMVIAFKDISVKR